MTKMNMNLSPMFLPLLLLQLIIPVTGPLLSVEVTSYNKSRTTLNGPVRCALDQVNQTSSSSSLQECSLNCGRDDTCAGFNIKSSLTCDHVMIPVLPSTSRTHSPVMCTIIIQRSPHLFQAAHSTRSLPV